jgi:lipopolysaccharide transport system ATP-binding protein
MAGHDTLRDHLTHGARALLRRFQSPGKAQAGNGDTETFWALKDVSFTLEEGAVLGVVGRNGAGKSTLLKILSQITEPTSGEIEIRGRVASLLEVGTGFHPELTGRENVFLNGAVLGMSRREIKAKFDEIVAFAEVERFLDTPVKRYSSGMYVRLAFAVAAHLEPEILIVDEVLAVGDAAFQKKCLGKMSAVADCGRTVLFVSHNLGAVQRLCTRGLYLEKGRLEHAGSIESVIDAYQRATESLAQSAPPAREPGSRPYQFLDWELKGELYPDKHACFSRDECEILCRLQVTRHVPEAIIVFALWNDHGDLIVSGESQGEANRFFSISPGLHEVAIKVRLPIRPGLYQIQFLLNCQGENLENCYLEPRLHVLPNLNTTLPEKWQGAVTEKVDFAMRETSPAAAAL